MSDNSIAPGFRFYPTEEELIDFYLRNKLEGRRDDLDRIIPVYDIYSLDPDQLPRISGELCTGDVEQWFFFSPRQEREAHGGRPNRITPSGYWKATGSPCWVYSSHNRIIGLKKTMVFYEGKAPLGRKTKWKVNEYRALEEALPSGATHPQLRSEFSLCRVYVKTGCLRSFDRRPLATTTDSTIVNAMGKTTPATNIDSNHSGAVLGSNAACVSTLENQMIKEEASSSSDHFHQSGVDQDTNYYNKMKINNLDSLMEFLNWD